MSSLCCSVHTRVLSVRQALDLPPWLLCVSQAAPVKAQNPAFVSSLGQGLGAAPGGQMGTSNNNYARPAGQNVSSEHPRTCDTCAVSASATERLEGALRQTLLLPRTLVCPVHAGWQLLDGPQQLSRAGSPRWRLSGAIAEHVEPSLRTLTAPPGQVKDALGDKTSSSFSMFSFVWCMCVHADHSGLSAGPVTCDCYPCVVLAVVQGDASASPYRSVFICRCQT